MKINSVQRDITLKQGNSGHLSKSNNFREKSADICNRGYYNDYCGSFTGKSEAAANVIKKTSGGKILRSGWFKSLVSAAEAHNVATSALIALGLAGILRPATTMALPGKKDKEDKIYASGHAISSGVLGFVVSCILTSPLDDAFTKCFKASEQLANIEYLKSGKTIKDEKVLEETMKLLKKPEDVKLIEKRASKGLKDMFLKMHELSELSKKELKAMKKNVKYYKLKKGAMSTLMKTMPEWVIAVPKASLTIALIPPILKYVFGLEKKKKTAPVENKEQLRMELIEKPVFKAMAGGIK